MPSSDKNEKITLIKNKKDDNLSVLIDVKFSVMEDGISGKYFHVFEYYPNRFKTRLGVIRYLLIVIGFLIFKIGIISPLIEL